MRTGWNSGRSVVAGDPGGDRPGRAGRPRTAGRSRRCRRGSPARPATVPWSWAATAVMPASREQVDRGAVGRVGEPGQDVGDRGRCRRRRRGTARRGCSAAAETRSRVLRRLVVTAATKCPARRRAPSRWRASARRSHHMSRGAWAMCCGSNVHTVPTLAALRAGDGCTRPPCSRSAAPLPRARSTRGMAMPVVLPARGAMRSSSTSS